VGVSRRTRLEQLVHGYVRGHELLAASIRPPGGDADEIARLSDLSGNLLGGDTPAYLTMYPLPSGSHYAVARTWPDRDAVRKGCVITRTVLVPMEDWRAGVPAGAVASVLKPIGRSELAGADTSLVVDWNAEPDRRELPRNLAGATPEFAERYFLEARVPVVWPVDEEPLDGVERLTFRLADFLWPARRATFSACTYALQPRYQGEDLFKLLFVPSGALNRFGEVPPSNILGREQRLTLKDPRAVRVVRGVTAVLLGRVDGDFWSTLNSLRQSLPDANDALLRVATLDDLAERGENNPNALVASLDVWAGLAPSEDTAVSAKVDAFTKALSRADSLDVIPALDLLSSSLQRLLRPPFRKLAFQRETARQTIVDRASRDVAGAISWLASDGKLRRDLTALVAQGIAKAATPELIALDKLLPDTPATSVLLKEEPRLTLRYLDDLPLEGSEDRLRRIEGWFSSCGPQTKIGISAALLTSKRLVHSESLLSAAVEQAVPEQVQPIFRAARDAKVTGTVSAPLSRLAERFPDHTRSYFMFAGIVDRTEADLFAEVLDETSITSALEAALSAGPSQAAWLADAFLRRWGAASLPPPVGRDLLRTAWRGLLAGERIGEKAVEKLALSVPPADLLAVVVPSDLTKLDSSRLRSTVLDTALNWVIPAYLDDAADVGSLSRWAEVARALDAGEVFDRATERSTGRTARRIRPERVWRLLEFQLSLLPKLGAKGYANRIAQVIRSTAAQHNPGSVKVWTRIVTEALGGPADRRESVSLLSFDAALRSTQSPVSPVLVVTFPVLHGGLPNKRRGTIFVGIFPLPVDIDKRQDARRELVDAFLRSIWPPGDLALAAHRAGVLPKVIGRLRHLRKDHYVERLIADLESRSDELCLSIARRVRTMRADDDD
jgi:hypothetical protein